MVNEWEDEECKNCGSVIYPGEARCVVCGKIVSDELLAHIKVERS